MTKNGKYCNYKKCNKESYGCYESKKSCESYESHSEESCESKHSSESYSESCYGLKNYGCNYYPKPGCNYNKPYIYKRKKYCIHPDDKFIPEQACAATQKPFKKLFKLSLKFNDKELSKLANAALQNELYYGYLVQYLNTIVQYYPQVVVQLRLQNGRVVYNSLRGANNTYQNFLNDSIGTDRVGNGTNPEKVFSLISYEGVSASQDWFFPTEGQAPVLYNAVATRVGLKKCDYLQSGIYLVLYAPANLYC